MARLRRDEEQRSYERMVNPPPRMETFDQRFPRAGMAHAFAEVNRPTKETDLGDDDVTYADVHRQLMLIVNFLVSIIGVGATIWIAARWWSTPARIFVTMAGSIIVAIAEVAVYSGYMWRLREAKSKQEKVKEINEVVQRWVVGGDELPGEDSTTLKEGDTDIHTTLRRRKKTDGESI
jgi:TMEM199 family protein